MDPPQSFYRRSRQCGRNEVGDDCFFFASIRNEIRLPRLSCKLRVAGINDHNGSYRSRDFRGLCLSSFTSIAFHRWRYWIPDLSIFNSGSHDLDATDIGHLDRL